MLKKKLGVFLLVLILIVASIPITFASADVEWMHIEAEEGASEKVLTLDGASGGKAIYGSHWGMTASNSAVVNIPKTTSYEVYAVLGIPINHMSAERGGYKFSIGEEKPFYEEYVPNVVPVNGKQIGAAFINYDSYEMHLEWVKIGTEISLEEGEITLNMDVTTGSSGTNGIGVIDCVRFVPTDWNWVPDGASLDDPVKSEPPEWMHIEAEEGASEKVLTLDGASGGKAIYGSHWGMTASNSAVVNIPKTTSYDIYAVLGIPINHMSAERGGYKFSIGEEKPFYQEYAPNVVPVNGKQIGAAFINYDSYKMHLEWVKIGTGISLEEGEITLNMDVTTGSSGTNGIGVIDCVRFVPTDWNWVPNGASLDAPSETLIVDEYAVFETVSGIKFTGASIEDDAYISGDAIECTVADFAVMAVTPGNYEIFLVGNGLDGAKCNDFSIETATKTYEKTSFYYAGVVSLTGGTSAISIKKESNMILDAMIILPAEVDFDVADTDSAEDAVVAADITMLVDTVMTEVMTENVSLPTVGKSGAVITYTSTAPNVFDINGKITRPAVGSPNAELVFTATGSLGEKTYSRQYSITVTAYQKYDVSAISVTTDDDSFGGGIMKNGFTYTFKATCKNNSTENDGTVAMIIYVYEGEKLMTSETYNKTIAKGETDTVSGTYQAANLNENVVVKATLFDVLEDDEPLVDSVELYGSRADGTPVYEEAELARLKSKFDAKNIGDGFTIGLITDVQPNAVTGYSTYTHHYGSLVKATKLIKMDLLADLGDMINGYTNNKQGELTLMAEQSRVLSKANLPVFRVKGNHDDNRWGCATFKNPNLYINDNEWLHANDVNWTEIMEGSTAGKQTYYYKDFEDKKIRIIALNSVDVPYEYSETLLFTYGFGNQQLKWLANEALDFSDKSDKSEWGVVFLSHVVTGDSSICYNFSSFQEIVNAFRTGASGSIKKTESKVPVDLSYNFESQGEMETICILSGDTHKDSDGTFAGMKSIVTRASLCYGDGREHNTATEDAWDVVTIDRTSRKIYCTRFGVGEDREFTY